MKGLRTALVAAVAIAASAAQAFVCRTDFGLVEVPEIEGFVPGDSTVKKAIQRTKKSIGGTEGKVSCVFVKESEAGDAVSAAQGRREYPEMFSLSQTSIENEITHDDFELVVAASRDQIDSLRRQELQGFRFGEFLRGADHYYSTIDITAADGGYAFTVLGGVFLDGHLYSCVSHSSVVRDAEARNAFLEKTRHWIERLVALNSGGRPASFRSAGAVFSTFPNISDYSVVGMALEGTARARAKGHGAPDQIDARFEHPKSMAETAPPQGMALAFSRTVDDYEFAVSAGMTRFDAALDGALDGFAGLKGDAAEAAAAELAGRLAAADRAAGVASGDETFGAGAMVIAGRNAVWRDSWRPSGGGPGSGAATKTIWVQADGLRAFRLEFALHDTRTPLVPVADLPRLNATMSKIAASVSFPDKKQFKRK